MRWVLFILSLFSVAACGESETQPSLSSQWKISGPFTSPESAIYDPIRDVIFVSNVAGYTENGLGYISTINLEGELLEERWLGEVNAPTGMAIAGDTLYVADFNRLVQIDIPSASIVDTYHVNTENPGMNDVTISPAGDVYVSASAISAVYQLKNDQLELWAQSEALQFANGLYADHEYLYVAGYFLHRIDLASRAIEGFGNEDLLIDLESIEADSGGGFFVSQIGDKPIMHVTSAGEITALFDPGIFTADMDYIHNQRILVAPSGGDTISAFKVEWLTP